MNNLRGMALITLIAVAACILILSVMQFGMGFEARVGFYLTAGAGAIALTAIYMTYLDAQKENTRAGRSLNKVILLQNRVKIRYVNNTNLLEYLYMKFGISSAAELEKLRKQYAEEKEERERIRENRKEMTYSQSELIKILKSYRFYDPMIWLHQAQALVDPKEMVEVRHALILRRQKLRQRLDFNSQNASAAQEQIRTIVAEYPEYAKEILKMISDFETGER
jgi:regulator of replication initiation timing